MAIDTQVVGSPGWWIKRLAVQLTSEQRRFQILQDYYRGRPPLAWGTEAQKSRFYRFQQTSRTNFAAVVSDSPCERIALRSVSTGADDDYDGDQKAWDMVRANNLDISLGEAARLGKRFGRAYFLTSAPDEAGGWSWITTEDPRQMITECDPVRTWRQRAALKLYHDPELQADVAVLWLPGEKWIATKSRTTPPVSRKGNDPLGLPDLVPVSFAAGAFTFEPFEGETDPETGETIPTMSGLWSERYDDLEIPVDVVSNRDGVGEFELHTDLLDRINHMILQRVVIATLQAFRQRAIKQSEALGSKELPEFDEEGNQINYNDVFEAGPDATWLLPPGAEIWESQQVDLQGILSAVKDDVLHLSAVTRTPMSMFTPDAVNQSAAGAQVVSQEMDFKVEDFTRTIARALSRQVARAFRYMGDESRGDAARVDCSFQPATRYTLAEMGQAAAQAGETLTWEQKQRLIWQQSPTEIALAKAQRAEDAVLNLQQARLLAQATAPAPQPAPVSPGVGAA